MSKFWELVRESIILQGIVTLLLLSTACYLWVVSVEVPQQLVDLLGIVVGFWLGSKAQSSVKRTK